MKVMVKSDTDSAVAAREVKDSEIFRAIQPCVCHMQRIPTISTEQGCSRR